VTPIGKNKFEKRSFLPIGVGLSALAFFIPLCSIKKSSNKASIPHANNPIHYSFILTHSFLDSLAIFKLFRQKI